MTGLKGTKKAKKRDAVFEQEFVTRYRHLVGCIVEVLHTAYDADDALNSIVLAGVLAEMKQIEYDYDKGLVFEK